MRKLINTVLLAAVAMPTAAVLPTAAGAQSRGEVRRSAQDVREERRELDRAYRTGDRGDIRDARDEYRDARQEYREDRRDYRDRQWERDRQWGRNDWRGYRDRNRNLYARGGWRAPFRYNNFRAGYRIAPVYFGQRYWINDPWRYRLPRPRPYTRWIRHYNDVVLVDYRRGIVVDVIRGFYW